MTTGIDVLDTSIQETQRWINDVQQRLALANPKLAYQALKATLHAVRDRVGPDNTLHFAAQLPLLVKGMLVDGWRPSQTPTRERTVEDFLDHVDRDVFGGLAVDPEAAVRAVLEVLAEHIDPREVTKLARLFPEDLRRLWPASASGAAASAPRGG